MSATAKGLAPLKGFIGSKVVSAFLVAQSVKNLSAMQEMQVWSLGWEDPLEKETAAHSSTLAWESPWTEKPAGLHSMGLWRVRQDVALARRAAPQLTHWSAARRPPQRRQLRAHQQRLDSHSSTSSPTTVWFYLFNGSHPCGYLSVISLGF